jgi:hypothetical protein
MAETETERQVRLAAVETERRRAEEAKGRLAARNAVRPDLPKLKSTDDAWMTGYSAELLRLAVGIRLAHSDKSQDRAETHDFVVEAIQDWRREKDIVSALYRPEKVAPP